MTCRGRRLYYLMKTEAQHPLERLDDLVIDGMKVWQRTDQFCFSIDAVMVAHFARVRSGRRYADLGTGTGVISLLLTALGADNITAFEINPTMAQLAKRNVAMNGRDDRITVIEGDYCQPKDPKLRESFDGIIVNPPYFAIGNGAHYGKQADGYMRLNIGCARSILQKGLDQMAKMYADYSNK